MIAEQHFCPELQHRWSRDNIHNVAQAISSKTWNFQVQTEAMSQGPLLGQCPRCWYGKPCCRWEMQKAMEWAWRKLCFLFFFFFLDHSFPGRDKLPDIPLTGAGRPCRHGGVISARCFSMLCLAMHISYTENGWYAENYLPLYFLKHKQKSTFCSNHHHSEGTMSDCERAWSKEKLCRNS